MVVCAQPTQSGLASLVVSDRGVSRSTIQLYVPGDDIHLVDPCDTTATLGQPSVLPCGKKAFHGDGTPVEAIRPAGVGEVLTMYALGLGQTQPLVPTGTAAPDPTPSVKGGFPLHFDYTPNAPPSPVYQSNSPRPQYVGVVPGSVGLYQINFVVPPVTSGYHSCGSSIVPVDIPVVLSSLTVTVSGPSPRLTGSVSAFCSDAHRPGPQGQPRHF